MRRLRAIGYAKTSMAKNLRKIRVLAADDFA
jgi:hypothetical protein